MNAPILSGVLWDMDGTIIDSEPLWIEAEHAMLERFGLTMAPETAQLLIGSGLWEAAELFRALGVELSADEIVDEWVAHVGAAMDQAGLDWRPGARELLAELRERGIPCALVTMSVRSLADRMVALLPDGTFGAVVAGDEVTLAKPDPEPYLRGADLLGVAIDQCVVFEDSPTGLRSAAASGAVAVGVTNLLDLSGTPAHEVWASLAGTDVDAVQSAFARHR